MLAKKSAKKSNTIVAIERELDRIDVAYGKERRAVDKKYNKIMDGLYAKLDKLYEAKRKEDEKIEATKLDSIALGTIWQDSRLTYFKVRGPKNKVYVVETKEVAELVSKALLLHNFTPAKKK